MVALVAKKNFSYLPARIVVEVLQDRVSKKGSVWTPKHDGMF